MDQRRLPRVGRRQDQPDRAQSRRHADARRQRPENYSGKGAVSAQQRAAPPGHLQPRTTRSAATAAIRRRTIVEDEASLVQTNPGSSTQIEVQRGARQSWCSSRPAAGCSASRTTSISPATPATDIRVEDTVLSTASVAAPRHEEQPNYRFQFDNSSRTRPGLRRLPQCSRPACSSRSSSSTIRSRSTATCTSSSRTACPTRVRIYNTPVSNLSFVGWYGFFLQDAWSIGSRLTLNVGGRFDSAKGWIPRSRRPAGTFVAQRSIDAASRRTRRSAPGVPASPTTCSGAARPRSRRAAAAMRTGRHRSRPARPSVPVHERHAHLDRPQRRPRATAERARRVLAASRTITTATPTPTAPTGRIRTNSRPASSTSW